MDEQSPTLANFARQSLIPRKVLLYLHRQHLIQDPPSRDDLLGLRLLEQVWGNKEILRPQLNRMSLRTRQSFLRTVSLNTKWERYAYSRFYNGKPGTRLSVRLVVDEIQTTFRFQLTKAQLRRVLTIRNRAQVARHRDLVKENQEPSGLLQTAN